MVLAFENTVNIPWWFTFPVLFTLSVTITISITKTSRTQCFLRTSDLKEIFTQLKSSSESQLTGSTCVDMYVYVFICLLVSRLFAALRTVAHQAPLSMGFSWQEYWSGLPFPPPGDLHNPGTEPTSLAGCLLHDRQIFSLIEPAGKPSSRICPTKNIPLCHRMRNYRQRRSSENKGEVTLLQEKCTFAKEISTCTVVSLSGPRRKG